MALAFPLWLKAETRLAGAPVERQLAAARFHRLPQVDGARFIREESATLAEFMTSAATLAPAEQPRLQLARLIVIANSVRIPPHQRV